MVIALIVCFIGGIFLGYGIASHRENLRWKKRYEALEDDYMSEFPESFEDEEPEEEEELEKPEEGEEENDNNE